MSDNHSSASLERFDRACARTFRVLGNVTLVFALFLMLLRMPNPPASDLDPSWRMAIGYALQHSLQFGKDIVFTYGPLGCVLAWTNSGGIHQVYLVWMLAANFIFALSIWLLGRGFNGWHKAAYFVYFFVCGVVYQDAVHMIAILIFSLALARDQIVARRWLAAALAFATGIMALVKFTNLMLAVLAIVCVLALHARRKHWTTAAVIAGGFAIAFFGGWIACGQSLANLPAYIVNSLNVSDGYVRSMGLEESREVLVCGLGAGFALAAYYVMALWRSPDFPRTLAVTSIAAGASFLNWKHGFVRADGHVLAHFFICLFFVFTFPVLLQDDGPRRRTKAALLVTCGAFSIVGIWFSSAYTITEAGTIVNTRIKDAFRTLAIIPHFADYSRKQFEAAAELNPLHGAKTLAAGRSVDVIGNDQGWAMLNRLNYHPRPTLQSYAAYSLPLARLNEAYIKSPQAPEFYLQRFQSIDHRMDSIDDAPLTRYLYHHYTLLMEEHNFLIWKRSEPNPALEARTLVSVSTFRFGQPLPAPDLGDAPVWCELEVTPSLLGRVRTFFYKPPQLNLQTIEGGEKNIHRFVPDQARAGFLLYPHFNSNQSVVRFEQGKGAMRITSLAITSDADSAIWFRPVIKARIYKLPPFPLAKSVGQDPPEVRFRVFSQPPAEVNSPYQPQIVIEDGKEVLLAHPPCDLEFSIDRSVRRVSGKFGMITRAYTDGHLTDGAEFIIDWLDQEGHTTRLFSRYLQPLTVAADRGEQKFDFFLPTSGGRLDLRTTVGPNDNISYDWAYWTDVKFEK